MNKHFGRRNAGPLFPLIQEDGLTREKAPSAQRFHLSTGAIKVICYTILLGYVATLLIIYPESAYALKDAFADWVLRGGIFK